MDPLSTCSERTGRSQPAHLTVRPLCLFPRQTDLAFAALSGHHEPASGHNSLGGQSIDIHEQRARMQSSSADVAAHPVRAAVLDSLVGLPPPLLQTVMHSLGHRDIVALACSCKYAMGCADSAFAWARCPAAELTCHESIPPSLPSRLLRRAALSVRLIFETLSASDIDRILQFASSVRIVKLHVSVSQLDDDCAVRLFSAVHAFQHVKELANIIPSSERVIAAVSALPALTALQLIYPAESAAVLAPLAGARGLRRLQLCDVNDPMDYLPRTQLRSLRMYDPKLDASNFVAFCSAMSGLEELSLEHWNADIGSSSVLAAGLQSLVSLQTLEWDMCSRYQSWLPLLPEHVPSLRQLVISDRSFPGGLDSLMRTAPKLHLKLRALRSEEKPVDVLRRLLLEPFVDRVAIETFQ